MFLKKILKQRHTLAFKLTIWYGSIFTLSSCIAFFIFYFSITSFVREKTDQDLLEKVKSFSTILSLRGINTLQKGAFLEAQAAGEKKIFFRMLYPNGNAFYATNMMYWKNIDASRKAMELLTDKKEYVFDTINIPNRKNKVRMLYSKIGPKIVLQLGYSMDHYSNLIEGFRKIFVITMFGLVVLAALIGWFMAKKALSGVEVVTRTAKEISEGNLDKRVPVKTSGDEIDQLAITFNQMLDKIESLITEIKEMTDNIAHDLRSPITSIRGIAEVTLTTSSSIDDYQNMAGSTIEECDRLLDMINTMLVISKTEAGVGKFELKTFDLAEVIRNAYQLFLPIAEDKSVKMNCDVYGNYDFKGDIRMIQRMIANLIDNAIKYTPPGGEIEVTLNSDDDNKNYIVIKDTGIGIPEKNLPYIFDRFYRCDPSRSSLGIGLGLSLAQAIAHAHNSEILVTSKLDEGSVFTILIPQNKDLNNGSIPQLII